MIIQVPIRIIVRAVHDKENGKIESLVEFVLVLFYFGGSVNGVWLKMADTDAIDASDFAEEVIETGVHRKTVRTSYRIEEVSTD